ncbi:MAG: DUF971 domain-containing protein [Cellvibrionaceae bacterium]|nr:DUF971 domain-containing protein [Cellvibrionaceae bacterium]
MLRTAITKLHLHKQRRILELLLANKPYHLSAEFLRVHSPSAEVQGHGPGQAVLVHGKVNIGIDSLKTTGNYGVRIAFDDGHDSGIYTWTYLADLCTHQDQYWQSYLQKLNQEKKNRDPHTSVVQLLDPPHCS